MMELKRRISDTALSFRGYNVTNLGRSRELLDHELYGPIVEDTLAEASSVCSEATGKHVDIASRIRAGTPTSLELFAEDVALIVGMEIAQLRLLEAFFDVDLQKARLAFGYSIGELGALLFAKVFEMREVLSVPLSLAEDCASLADDVTMAIVFSRGPSIDMDAVHRMCALISCEGKGLIGPSAYLSPNTVLLLGEGKTVSRFQSMMKDHLGTKVMLRRNSNKWPPLHTPIMWRKNIRSRSALLLHQTTGGFTVPTVPIISCVTGKQSYKDFNVRDHLIEWTDHPQMLWDVVCQTLSAGVDLIIHVGPEPNLIPATFSRLAANIENQLGGRFLGSFGSSVVTRVARSWLSHSISAKTALLRAPFVEHIILEDWLLAQKVAKRAVASVNAT